MKVKTMYRFIIFLFSFFIVNSNLFAQEIEWSKNYKFDKSGTDIDQVIKKGDKLYMISRAKTNFSVGSHLTFSVNQFNTKNLNRERTKTFELYKSYAAKKIVQFTYLNDSLYLFFTYKKDKQDVFARQTISLYPLQAVGQPIPMMKVDREGSRKTAFYLSYSPDSSNILVTAHNGINSRERAVISTTLFDRQFYQKDTSQFSVQNNREFRLMDQVEVDQKGNGYIISKQMVLESMLGMKYNYDYTLHCVSHKRKEVKSIAVDVNKGDISYPKLVLSYSERVQVMNVYPSKEMKIGGLHQREVHADSFVFINERLLPLDNVEIKNNKYFFGNTKEIKFPFTVDVEITKDEVMYVSIKRVSEVSGQAAHPFSGLPGQPATQSVPAAPTLSSIKSKVTETGDIFYFKTDAEGKPLWSKKLYKDQDASDNLATFSGYVNHITQDYVYSFFNRLNQSLGDNKLVIRKANEATLESKNIVLTDNNGLDIYFVPRSLCVGQDGTVYFGVVNLRRKKYNMCKLPQLP